MKATQEMCSMLMERIALTLRGHVSNSELAAAVRPEMNLLAALVHKEDTCWELKLRYLCSAFKCSLVLIFLTQ
jgi:E3 ubiquitin-protein ligase UBR4